MGQQTIKALKYERGFVPFWEVLAFPVAAFLWLRLGLIDRSSKTEITGEGSVYTEPAIYVNWHKHLPFLVHHHGTKNRTILVSRAPYMEPIAKWCAWSGLHLIRGASGENGKAALDRLAHEITKGHSIVLAVDGPAGPAYRSKRGCVELSRLTGAPIIPVTYQCEKGKPNLKRWDQSLMPRLFDKISLHYGAPVFPKSDFSEEAALREIDSALGVVTHPQKL